MGIFRKGSKANSIFGNKCPNCQEGKFWPAGPLTNILKNKGGMYESCNSCGFKYEREVGFWYGAMYVSYAIGIAAFVTFWVATEVLMPEDANILAQIGIVIAGIIVTAPLNYWLSRLIWINMFVKFGAEDGEGNEVSATPKIIN